MRVLLALGVVVCLVQVAAAQSYHVQPGDALTVSVWQDPKLDRQVIVGPDGTISFPLAGHIRAAGLTLSGIEAALKTRLKDSYREQLDVSVALAGDATVPQTIYVTGEVNNPGAFPFDTAGTSTVQAIALSGGFGPFAATRRIQIFRKVNGQEYQFTFNYQDYESGRDLSGNLALRPGDVVVVPEKRLFEH